MNKVRWRNLMSQSQQLLECFVVRLDQYLWMCLSTRMDLFVVRKQRLPSRCLTLDNSTITTQSLQVDNASGKPVKEINAILEQVISYHGTYTPTNHHNPKGKKKSRKKAVKRGSDIKKTKVFDIK